MPNTKSPITLKERRLDTAMRKTKRIGLWAYIDRELGKGTQMVRIAIAIEEITKEPVNQTTLYNWIKARNDQTANRTGA